MISTIPISPSFSFNPTITNTPNLPLRLRHRQLTVKAHSSTNSLVLHHLKNIAGAAIFTAATATAALTFPISPARAEPPETLTEVLPETETETIISDAGTTSPPSELLESVEALKSLLQQKLELGEVEEALKILKSLISSQPEVTEWKFIAARLTIEMGDTDAARSFYEEILNSNPLSFEALFENALLMDRVGEGDVVLERLEDALRVAVEDNKEKEARDVKLIMARILFLQKNIDEALGMYQLLIEKILMILDLILKGNALYIAS
jgi:tetratricopeptide (TPR) repeat protein